MHVRRTTIAASVAMLLASMVLVTSSAPSSAQGSFAESSSAAEVTGGNLQRYFIEAARENPGLRGHYESWMAASEKVAFSKGWPDPRVSYTLYLQEVETALGPQKHAFAFSQMFPWFGKLSLKGSAQEKASLAAAERFRRARLDLFTAVAKAYYNVAYLERSISITKENLELLKYHESVARIRYRTDTARYTDLIKVQVELGALDDRLRTLQDRVGATEAKLNSTLGRPADAALEWSVDLTAPVPIRDDEATIRERTLRDNPTLLALQHDVDRKETLRRLANRNRYPDFTLGVKNILTDESDLTAFDDRGRDAWMMTLGMNLPLWQGKYKAAVRSEAAGKRAAEFRLKDATHKLDSQLERALFELRDAERKVDLFSDGLVPKAQQSLESTATAYEAGTKTFLDFLDAQRTLLVFELDLAKARANLGQRRVEVTSLMGISPSGARAEYMLDEGAQR
jgi:outer membrane protein, heavy metal efflux system